MKRLRVYFKGHVQGVGFRFSVEHIARKFPITGYVKNLVDGRVEMVAEADEETLKLFLNAICSSHLEHYIHDCMQSWSDAIGEFEQFSIRF